MGGRIKPKTNWDGHVRPKPPEYTRPRDMTGKWEASCSDLAIRLGYHEREIWHLFQQLAAMREYEHVVRYGREIHEAMAFDDIEAIYTKADDEQLPC